jgi:hypothetical protein
VRKFNEAVASLEGRVLPAAGASREMGIGSAEIESPSPIELQPSPAGRLCLPKTMPRRPPEAIAKAALK